MKVRYPFLHSFSIKNILYDEMDLFSCDEMKKKIVYNHKLQYINIKKTQSRHYMW